MKKIPITRPTLEPFARYARRFRRTIDSGMLTTGPLVKEFEQNVARYLGVKHCVAVSSCTSGLMLSMRGLGLTGEVIMPSFTFSASGLPLAWNGLTPVFADIDPETLCIDPEQIERLITPRTSAIFATHVFGVPCDVAPLEKLAKKHRLKLIFDAAHAFGSTYRGKKVGTFGDVEVFSCSPTKVLTTGEGGIVATNDAKLADYVRRGRNYGDDGTSEVAHAGLSARMSEFHAALGLVSLAGLRKNLARRIRSAEYFKKRLYAVEPRLRFQSIPKGATTTYKDLSVRIDPKMLGYTRDQLYAHFEKQNIVTRKYFYPALHNHATYAKARKGILTATEETAENVLSLPMYSHITKQDIERVIRAFEILIHERKKH